MTMLETLLDYNRHFVERREDKPFQIATFLDKRLAIRALVIPPKKAYSTE